MRSIYDNNTVLGAMAIYNSSPGIVHTSPSVDTKGYNSAALRFLTTAVGGSATAVATRGTLAAILQESDDNSTFTTATDVSGTTIGATVAPTTTNGALTSVRVEGLMQNRKRYLRMQLTSGFGPSATAAGIFTCTAVIELGRAYNRPVTSTVSNT